MGTANMNPPDMSSPLPKQSVRLRYRPTLCIKNESPACFFARLCIIRSHLKHQLAGGLPVQSVEVSMPVRIEPLLPFQCALEVVLNVENRQGDRFHKKIITTGVNASTRAASGPAFFAGLYRGARCHHRG